MPMNPVDMFFAVIQGTIAVIMLLNVNDLGLSPGIIYFLVIMLVISAIWDFFD